MAPSIGFVDVFGVFSKEATLQRLFCRSGTSLFNTAHVTPYKLYEEEEVVPDQLWSLKEKKMLGTPKLIFVARQIHHTLSNRKRQRNHFLSLPVNCWWRGGNVVWAPRRTRTRWSSSRPPRSLARWSPPSTTRTTWMRSMRRGAPFLSSFDFRGSNTLSVGHVLRWWGSDVTLLFRKWWSTRFLLLFRRYRHVFPRRESRSNWLIGGRRSAGPVKKRRESGGRREKTSFTGAPKRRRPAEPDNVDYGRRFFGKIGGCGRPLHFCPLRDFRVRMLEYLESRFDRGLGDHTWFSTTLDSFQDLFQFIPAINFGLKVSWHERDGS